jgi:hypothetical protein
MMIRLSDEDYSETGLSIVEAFLEASGAYPGRTPLDEPAAIRWGGHDVIVADIMRVPERGHVRLRALHRAQDIRQGVDLDVSPGRIILVDGTEVPVLRTWFDSEYEDLVEYDYHAPRGLLRTHNVYELRLGNHIREDKWGDYAAMWTEDVGPRDRIYHCNSGLRNPPTFDDLVYRVTVS